MLGEVSELAVLLSSLMGENGHFEIEMLTISFNNDFREDDGDFLSSVSVRNHRDEMRLIFFGGRWRQDESFRNGTGTYRAGKSDNRLCLQRVRRPAIFTEKVDLKFTIIIAENLRMMLRSNFRDQSAMRADERFYFTYW